MGTHRDACTLALVHFDESSGSLANTGVLGGRFTTWGSGHGVSSSSKFGANCYQAPAATNAGFTTTWSPRLPGTGPFMLSIWVYLPSYPTSVKRRIFGIGQPSAAKPALEITPAGVALLEQRNTSNLLTTMTGTIAIPLNQWAHIEAHRVGSTTRLLVDGVIDQSSGTVIDMGSDIVGSVELGGRSDSVIGILNARLDEAIYLCGTSDHDGAFTPETAAYADPALPEVGIQADPLALQSWTPTWPSGPEILDGPLMLVRVFVGGDGRIVGTVTIKGTPNIPVRRRVRLYREVDGLCVGEQWSDATTGAYSFFGFDRTITYTVLAYDGPRVFKATLADGVIPELIT